MARPDSPEADIQAIEARIDAGGAHETVGTLRAMIEADPADPAPCRLGARALSVAAGPAWGEESAGVMEDWHALIRHMVLQRPRGKEPRILHHTLASLLTSDNRDTARDMVAAVLPALHDLLEAGSEPGLVLFLLVGRSVLPDGHPARGRISRLHLAHFPAFSVADLSLPYSVKFNAEAFGANRDDLLGRYPSAAAALDPRAGLGLRHLLLLDRLGAGPLFGPDSGPHADRGDTSLHGLLHSRLRLEQEDDQAGEEREAARALVLRYGDTDGDVTADVLGDLGLQPDLLELSRSLPSLPRAKAGGRLGAQSLGSRRQQVLRGLLNRACMAAPSLALIGPKPRVALCVSGQLRGFETALETWRHSLLPFADFDIYIHTWSDVGRASPQPFRAVLPFAGDRFCREWKRVGTLIGFEEMQARYRHLFEALARTQRIGADDLKALYGARAVVVDDDTQAPFTDFSNQEKMHHKIFAAHDLAARSGETYDLVMRLRPDLELRLPGFSWRTLWRNCREAAVLYADGAYGVHYQSLMIGDQLAIGAPDTMKVYAATWKTYPAAAAPGLDGFPKDLTGHVSLAQSCWLAGIDVQHLPYRRGRLVEAETLSVSRTLAALEADIADTGDVHDTALLDACRADAQAS